MAQLLTQMQLKYHLNSFRHILKDFDYSELNNIRFLNLESFYTYMETVEGNPFQKQYNALQKELDILQPYLPFISSARAKEFLHAITKTQDEDEIQSIKQEYTKKLRQDFIHFSRTVTTDSEWENLISTCEEIRSRKEESLLSAY